MTPKKINWRTAALIFCLALSISISIAAFRAANRGSLPDWIVIQEGPIAHGIDKFYRNCYFKGDIETAGDLTVAGATNLADTITLTTAILDKLIWQDASGGVITSTRTLTPTETFYQIDPDASGNITITLAACTEAEQELILYNSLTRTVAISSANVLPSTLIVLNQYDAFMALCDGTGWRWGPTSLTGRNGETITNDPDGEWDFGAANLDTSGNIEGAALTASGNATIAGNAIVASNAVITGNTTITGSATISGATTIAGTTTMSGDASVGGNATVTGDTTLAGNESITGTVTTFEATGTLTVTQWLTPTATLYQIDPAAGVTLTLGACSQLGQWLTLYNDDGQTVLISSTNVLPTAMITMTQHDVLSLLCDGAAWVKASFEDN